MSKGVDILVASKSEATTSVSKTASVSEKKEGSSLFDKILSTAKNETKAQLENKPDAKQTDLKNSNNANTTTTSVVKTNQESKEAKTSQTKQETLSSTKANVGKASELLASKNETKANASPTTQQSNIQTNTQESTTQEKATSTNSLMDRLLLQAKNKVNENQANNQTNKQTLKENTNNNSTNTSSNNSENLSSNLKNEASTITLKTDTVKVNEKEEAKKIADNKIETKVNPATNENGKNNELEKTDKTINDTKNQSEAVLKQSTNSEALKDSLTGENKTEITKENKNSENIALKDSSSLNTKENQTQNSTLVFDSKNASKDKAEVNPTNEVKNETKIEETKKGDSLIDKILAKANSLSNEETKVNAEVKKDNSLDSVQKDNLSKNDSLETSKDNVKTNEQKVVDKVLDETSNKNTQTSSLNEKLDSKININDSKVEAKELEEKNVQGKNLQDSEKQVKINEVSQDNIQTDNKQTDNKQNSQVNDKLSEKNTKTDIQTNNNTSTTNASETTNKQGVFEATAEEFTQKTDVVARTNKTLDEAKINPDEKFGKKSLSLEELMKNAKDNIAENNNKNSSKSNFFSNAYASSQRVNLEKSEQMAKEEAINNLKNANSTKDVEKSAQKLNLNLQNQEVVQQKTETVVPQKILQDQGSSTFDRLAAFKASLKEKAETNNALKLNINEEVEKLESKVDIKEQKTVELSVNTNLAQSIQNRIVAAKQQMSSMMSDLARSMYENYKPPVTAFRVNLNPAALGSIAIVLRSEQKSNTISVSMNVSNTATKETMLENQNSLKESLSKVFQGDKEFELDFGTDDNSSFEDNKQEFMKQGFVSSDDILNNNSENEEEVKEDSVYNYM